MGRLALILGGARSGKSRRAEALALEWGGDPIYLATAQVFDDEMRERVALHWSDRAGRGWTTVEEALDLPVVLASEATVGRTVLVECLTTWVGNLMVHERPVDSEIAALLARLDDGVAGDLVLVANEVGLGIVPDNRMAREFRDHAGRLHQELAARAGRVELVVAGIPVLVKG